MWRAYVCARCGGLVTAYIKEKGRYIEDIFPYDEGKRSKDIPEKARSFLEQAISSIHVPAGALMLAASSVDAMLKNKGYVDGSLYSRIDKAEKDHLVTSDMAKWAHRVRLDANDQRHADRDAPLPTENDAKRAIAFTEALAQFLFVMPAMVDEGLRDAQPKEEG